MRWGGPSLVTVLGSQLTEVTTLLLVEADELCAHNFQVPCSSRIGWLGSVSMLYHTIVMLGFGILESKGQ